MSIEILPGESAYKAYKRIYLKPIVELQWNQAIAAPANAGKYLDDKKKITPEGRELLTKLFKDAFTANENAYNIWRKEQGVQIREVDPALRKTVISETVLPDARKMVVYSRGTHTKASVTLPDGSEQKFNLVPVKERPKDPNKKPEVSLWTTWTQSDQAKAIRAKVKSDFIAEYKKSHPAEASKPDSEIKVKIPHAATMGALSAAYQEYKKTVQPAAAPAK